MKKHLIIALEQHIKRILDFGGALVALCILVPALPLLSLLIWLDSGPPVFFKQERIGKNGVPFAIIKFRTMKYASEPHTIGRYVNSNDPSLTRLGRFLRRWGLDELPQLVNVLKGEMSLIGPRPTLRYQVVKYDEIQKRRLEVKPGITGWAQVNGRNALNWQQRMTYDIWYIDNWSLALDLRILALTPAAILRKEFAFADGIDRDDIVSTG